MDQSFYVTFRIDGFTKYLDRVELIDRGEILLYGNPDVERFTDNVKELHIWRGETSITIKVDILHSLKTPSSYVF